MNNLIQNVVRDNNVITIKECNHPKCVSDFLRVLKDAIYREYKEIVIESEASLIFPNACVPIVGIIHHFMQTGVNFNFNISAESYLSKCGFMSPYKKEREELQKEKFPFDKIFYYETSGQVADITQAYIDAISHQSVCEQGVLSGLSWCINEVMDNVLTHSESGYGLVMAQYHALTKHVVFCIYDSGIGIHKSLCNSPHHPRTEIDAISISMQEGVGDGKGQGNGLFGLYQIVHENQGRLTITSGASSIMIQKDGEIGKFEFIPFIDFNHKGTIVDFQLDLNKPIDIKKAFNSIGGFDGFDIRIDNMIEENDFIHYDIFENSQGTATRQAGEYIRNDIENILKRVQNGIVLDFQNVKNVSSSFIDELIAKMVLDLGFVSFNNSIRLMGMTSEIKFLCERSLYMRVHDSWKER